MALATRIRSDPLARILGDQRHIALFIGNGINRHVNDKDSSWDDLLTRISKKQKLILTEDELREMSNTERFDILDIAKPTADPTNLKQLFCDLMRDWRHAPHHTRIVQWAQRHAAPIITVNFDENLSQCAPTKFYLRCGANDQPRFTDWYPWRSYFGVQPVENPTQAFGIWHAHGMLRYVRSIRLGLTDYMGSVDRARAWIYRGDASLVRYLQGKSRNWHGMNTWLHPFFGSDIVMIGFGFGKDETFLRWLFLERARLYRRFPSKVKKAWFVVGESAEHRHRQPFLKHLGIELVMVKSRAELYETLAWDN